MNDSKDEAQNLIQALVSQLELDEKAEMAAGTGLWRSTGSARLGIAQLKLSDGPNGVRGDSQVSGMSSACFPVSSCVAASWNVALVKQLGEAVAQECRDKNVQVVLGPTVNLHRSPLAGRNFECFSEDPVLSAALAKEWILAVQGLGVACCIKHFVANESEFERHSISSQVDVRTLHELYLRPFEIAVKEAGVWSIMSAYNQLNGQYASGNEDLLTHLLKQDWGFDGVVVSDWGGTYSTIEAAQAGLDLEMPGPARFMGEHLANAVRSGEVAEDLLDDKVARVLRLMQRTGRLSADSITQNEAENTALVESLNAELEQEQAVSRQPQRDLIRRIAAEGMVLLKNHDVLPLNTPGSIALIGPNALNPGIMGGGSSFVAPHVQVSPLQGLQDAFTGVEIALAQGCTAYRYLPLISGTPIQASFYNSQDLSGEVVLATHPRRTAFTWFGRFSAQVKARFSASVTLEVAVQKSGVHQFGLLSAGLSRLYLNDELLIDNWNDWQAGASYMGNGSDELSAEINLEAGSTAHLRIEYRRENEAGLSGLRLGHLPPPDENLLEDAVELARQSEVALVLVGLNPEWETEGSDRLNMHLPGDQVKLIQAVAAVNDNVIVVVNAGSPICMWDWVDDVGAVLFAWYPGQEFGAALADLISGQVNPSGRLPTTFAMRAKDTAAYGDCPKSYPGESGAVHYSEGLHLGYRHFDKQRKEADRDDKDFKAAQYPFGFGLSYTKFEYSDLQLDALHYSLEQSVLLEFTLKNAGQRAGQEVIQVYVAVLDSPVEHPVQELKKFSKIFLEAGQSQRVRLELKPKDFEYFEVATAELARHALDGTWRAYSGKFEIRISRSATAPLLSQLIERNP